MGPYPHLPEKDGGGAPFLDPQETVTIPEVEPEVVPLVPGFLENRRADVEIIPSLVTSGAYARIQRLGHNMKGCGESYGFPRITDIGRALEKAAREEDGPKVLALTAELSKVLASIQLAVAKLGSSS